MENNINLQDYKKWRQFTVGEIVSFSSSKPRILKIFFNAPEMGNVYMLENREHEHFLARIEGYCTFQMYIDRPVDLVSDVKDLMIYSSELEFTHGVVEAPEIYTKIMVRRKRNHELEHLMFQMQQNTNARFALQQDQFDKVLKGIKDAAPVAPKAEAEPVKGKDAVKPKPKPNKKGKSPTVGAKVAGATDAEVSGPGHVEDKGLSDGDDSAD